MTGNERDRARDSQLPPEAAVDLGAGLITQEALAQRWGIATATLERWRSVGMGPRFVKLVGKVRYRPADVIDFENVCLRRSTSGPA